MPLSPDARFKAEALVIAALESDEAESRRIATEAQLNYRLRESFQRIDTRREIDLNYLTCSEYQLFLDDMRAQDKFFQPDHWTDYQFPKGKALEPVLGVRPKDAEAFCKWLTQRRSGSNERYRLPTTEEAYQYLLPKEMIATWCRDVGEFNLSGLTSDEERKIKQELGQILNRTPPSLALLDWEPDLATSLNDFFNTSAGIYWVYSLVIILLLGGIMTIVFIGFTPISIGLLIGTYGCVVSSFRDDDDGILSNMIAGVVVSLVCLLYFSCKGLSNDISVTFSLSMGFGWMLGGLLVRLAETINNFLMTSPASNESVGDILTNPLAKEVFSDLLLREYKLPIMKNDQKLAINILKDNLNKHSNKKWNKFMPKWHRGIISRNVNDALQSQNRKEYEWLKVIIARKEGNLLAWEGIRLVREYM